LIQVLKFAFNIAYSFASSEEVAIRFSVREREGRERAQMTKMTFVFSVVVGLKKKKRTEKKIWW